ncbi:MAG: hypothetical protein QOH88_3390 [Verrucomicrobiota bacterium]|jgi:hypothetical protein
MRKLFIISLLLIPLLAQGASPALPSDKELKALVFDSLFAFNKAVQEKSFAKFHEERLSPLFQKQFPLEKFTATFQVFLEKNYDISNIAKSDPVFDKKPAIDSDGLLVVEGYYPTRPNKVTFKLTYINEASAWKLLGINVQVVPVADKTGKAPSITEIKKLALDSLLLFNVAIQTKSFDDFYSKIAKLWQKEITPAKLLSIFQSFVEKGVNIAPIANKEPKFDETPAVNEDGFLVVKGSYPTQPSNVLFQLKYTYEDESWKLVAINVEVKPTGSKPETSEKSPTSKPDKSPTKDKDAAKDDEKKADDDDD